jgi:PleD family two-component response regulator
MTKWKTRSIICVPLQSKHRVLGVIQLINCAMESFGEQEMFFLHALCDYAAIAIDNARAVEKIQELTITDDCTGLYNARHLYKTLEAEVYRSARFGYEFSVIFLDLDHFKHVNDTYGHLVGSKLLQEIGLLPQTDKHSALVVAKRIQDMMRKTVFLAEDGLNLNVRCSMGLATYPEDAKSSHEIIRQADEMMYMVKNSSRDNIAVAQQGILK